MTDLPVINHWIDGAPSEGASTRTAPVFNPAKGTVAKNVRLASTGDVDTAVASALAAYAGWADTSQAKRQSVMFNFRELLNARKGELADILTAEHGKVTPTRSARSPRPRGRRVRARHPAPVQGRVLRERVDRRRRVLAPPAARRRRHHQPVQLSGHGAVVVLPDRDRRRQHGRAQAEREGPVGVQLDGRALHGGRPARRRLQRRARRQGGRRRAARAPGRRVDLLRRLHPDREVHLRDRRPPRQAGAGPRRREEPHARAAGCRPRPRPRGGRRGQRRASARPASAAWRSASSSPSSPSPTS